jgi:hypothetical protein
MDLRRAGAFVGLFALASCGGGSGGSGLSVKLLTHANRVAIHTSSGGSEVALAAFALGRLDAGDFLDLVLAPTDGWPGCVGFLGPAFPQMAGPSYGWFSYPPQQSVVVADFAEEDGLENDAVTTTLSAEFGTWMIGGVVGSMGGFWFPDPWDQVRGGAATRVIAGDWDDDGHQDVALLEPASLQVRVLFGDGTGALAASTRVPSVYETGLVPLALLATDVNEDGRPDILVTNGIAGTLEVLLGGIDGAFSATLDADAVPGGQYLTAADFDGDGHVDVAVSGSLTDQVAVLRGNGDGSFQAPTLVALPADSEPSGIAAGDFDGDGDLDLVVGLAADGDLAVVLGDGDGGFALPASFRYACQGSPRQVEAAHNDDDGKVDVFVLLPTAVQVFRQT